MYNEGSLGSVCNVLLFLNKSFFFYFFILYSVFDIFTCFLKPIYYTSVFLRSTCYLKLQQNIPYLDVTVISIGLHTWRAVAPEFLAKFG